MSFLRTAEGALTIAESASHDLDVQRNRIWYRGDPYELEQYFSGIVKGGTSSSRFWASTPSSYGAVRKIHSGLPKEIVDKLVDIIVSDLDAIMLKEQELWDTIANDNRFSENLLSEALREAFIAGDGAFKISIDESLTQYPILEFYGGESVEYETKRGRLQAVIFKTQYTHERRVYDLHERYGRGSITYHLYDARGDKIPVSTIPELRVLSDYAFKGDFIAAIPMKFYDSPFFRGRGQSIFGNKSDAFDSLDEVVSQWVDAVRAGRVKNYIPEDLLLKDDNGLLMNPNPFDNMFIAMNSSAKEDSVDKIEQIQADINYEAYMESYRAMIDMSLQGIISPATLGIDLKKRDNAEAQREKEKTTLYTRDKIIDVLNEVVPNLVDITLKVYANMKKSPPTDHQVSIQFGQYASPEFGEKLQHVGEARANGIMSLEKAMEQLYGDTLSAEEKALEVERLRKEQNLFDEPHVGIDGLDENDL